MYDNIKSCVKFNEEQTSFFKCNNGVRQGENLSPLLFAMYLNDLESFILSADVEPINLEYQNDEVLVYLKLLLLLYADDTVIFSDNEENFRKSLDSFYEYCLMWKLKVNFDKTKIIIFNKQYTTGIPIQFKLGEHEIEVIEKYKYLGTLFYKTGSFIHAKKYAAEQARKAMHLLFIRANNLDLPIDLQIKLFDNTVLPILTYGSEIHGHSYLEIIERIHTEFLRKITKSRKSTPKYMLYAELGRHPIQIDVKVRMIEYWSSVLNGKQSKLSYQIYKYMYKSQNNYKWPTYIKSILNDCGLNYIWQEQFRNIPKNITKQVKNRLLDQNIQVWSHDLQKSSKGLHYALFKDNIGLESYLTKLDIANLLNMFKFRTCNHRFPVEVGRWDDTDLDSRKCELCLKNDIGDNFHYLLICPAFENHRKRFIIPYFYIRPNVIKYKELLNITSEPKLKKLSMFMKILINHFNNNN